VAFVGVAGDYLKVGTNSTFVVQPSIVHFGGYDVNSVHRTTVRIVNQSATSQRITLLTPNTPFFKVRASRAVGGSVMSSTPLACPGRLDEHRA
jgi:hypothetical protein